MKQFEYKEINSTRASILCDMLNDEGRAGWELVSVTTTDVFRAWLKRDRQLSF